MERRNSNRQYSLSSVGSRAPLSPSDSCTSLGSFRPSLVWLFNRIRHEDQDCLTKDDLCHLLGTTVDSAQLDEAFERLDLDGDGLISLDEFIAGFATFWREAPHTPTPAGSLAEKAGFAFPTRQLIEEHYESQRNGSHDSRNGSHDSRKESVDYDETPSVEFESALNVLSSHNRNSIESLWKSIRDANPELLSDFEEFVGEVAEEVQGAQRALDKQRRATKKEARELDAEIESRLSDARTTLQIQTALVKQQVQTRLQERLVEKEAELRAVKGQLNELEAEIVDRQSLLEKQCQQLNQEKLELSSRLEVSEKRLESTQTTMESLQTKAEREVMVHEIKLEEQEKELLHQKTQYEDEIIRLKEQLEHYKKHGDLEGLTPGHTAEAQPDLLATTRPHPQLQHSKNSLMEEIVQKEGVASPMLRGEQLLEPSPFFHRSGSFVVRRRRESSKLQNQRDLTMSLPNLLDIDKMDEAPSHRHSVFIPVYVGADGRHGLPPDNDGDEDGYYDDNEVERAESPEVQNNDHVTSTEDHVTAQSDLVTSSNKDDYVMFHPLQEEDWESEFNRLCQPLQFIEALATQPDYVFKILVVGNSYVGKSSFLMRLCTNAFIQRYSSTIGVDFYSKALKIDEKIVSLQLWDTAGQERFQSVTKAYYRGAQGVILMYDISQEESFIAVKSWINAIQDNVEEMPAGLLLVGNKVDLEEQGEREVSMETGETFAKIYGADFMEASAKTGYNVGPALLKLVRAVKRHYEESGSKATRRSSTKVTEDTQESDSKCCGSR